MKIILLFNEHGIDHPDVETLRTLLEQSGVSFTETTERPPGIIKFIPCAAALYDNGVAANCFGTAATTQDISDAHAASGTPPAKQPNNPGNPYFGKAPKTPDGFWGYMMGVYVAIASGADAAEKKTNGLARLGRLTTSTTANPVVQLANSVELIDPDDRKGDFLKMIDLLTTAKHEDGQLLMTVQELAAAMTAWN